MLSVIDKEGSRLFVQVILFSLMLAAVSVIPALADMAGPVYLVGAILLALYVMRAALLFIRRHTRDDARRLLLSTIFYLPALLIVILADLAVVSLWG
jgi:protoheme IX farnesyltransferase